MNKFNQLTPEIVYWATGRTKIYPEKEFASNYRRIKSGSEKQFKSEVSLFKKHRRILKYPLKGVVLKGIAVFMVSRVGRHHLNDA